MTREEKNAWQREYRARNKNMGTKAYEKTPQGFLMRAYRNMKSRITGVQAAKHHLYEGKELLPKQDFYEWSRNNRSFARLFKAWVEAGYDQRLTPSVNRIDSRRGYSLDNMEWITHSQNSRDGAVSPARKNAATKVVYNILGVKS